MKIRGRKFWTALVLFGLIGQVAWVVENMYLNVFIYKMFHASAANISLMVSASSVAATLTTVLIGALSDYVGKRKIFICGGYLVWGISILSFSLVRMDVLNPLCGGVAEAAALGVSLVIILDCIMTFFGSAANDAAYNAWLTDAGDESNRGRIEGINAMMPLVAILVVFGGFMGFNLDEASSWSVIFTVIGCVVLVIGGLGIFLIEEVPGKQGEDSQYADAVLADTATITDSVARKSGKAEHFSYLQNVLYSFRIDTFRDNKLLYAIIGAFAVFGISINTYMPYLIVYYEKTLQMSNYVMIFAPAIILAAAFTAVYGTLYDKLGFQMSVIPSMFILMTGYVILYFSRTTVPVFIGSLLMMCGYLSGMAVFGAKIREHIPESMAGRFQGVRIIGQVLIPGVVGPSIGAFVLRNAEMIENNDGTFSFLPNKNIWLAALVVALVLYLVLMMIFYMIRTGHHDLFTEAGECLKQQEDRKISHEACEDVSGDDNAQSCHHKNGSNPWNVYPRPQMKRESFSILSDNWTLNGVPIRVPFPPQSSLSGYGKKVGSKLIYETVFTIPTDFQKKRILLHFGAVDQIAEVYVNGELAGTHEGGYLPFTFDITERVHRNEENQLEVRVTDRLNRKYPYGKQCKKRGGMWYTPVSGIWQNVWLENVPETYIEKVILTPDLEGVFVRVKLAGALTDGVEGEEQAGSSIQQVQPDDCTATIRLHNGETWKVSFQGEGSYISLTEHVDKSGQSYIPQLWSVDNPYLYEMTLETDTDKVETYFALRQIDIQERDGIKRVCLNNKPVFLHGVLDQGYFPEGIFLPAEPEEYERDILRMKELGFNMLRKHIKIEPEAFYYYCDKHGMLVVQDMVNNGGYSFLRDTALPTIGMKTRKDVRKDNETSRIFKTHMKATLEHLFNHPSIVVYTLFNEGWGQFNSDEIYDLAKATDDSRLYDSTSGWFAQHKNDFDSEHIYFKTTPPEIKQRPVFVSECGGYSQVVPGHFFSKYNSYGYGGSDTEEALTELLVKMYEEMIIPGIQRGICGCVYTQLSDIEDEVNGLYTYDRKVCKVNKEIVQGISAKIYANNGKLPEVLHNR